MAPKPDPVSKARHARLFELIRQDNVAGGLGRQATRRDALNPADMQRFLKQARQSLKSENNDLPML